jgi:peptidoglycan hydrolase-like protein with peptidoglycan-binding domain
MPDLSYAQGGLTLSLSETPSPLVRDLQRDLRLLGYHKGGIDGVFGGGTAKSVRALQYDLLSNTGTSSNGDGSAPVAVAGYNRGRVVTVSGVLDQNLAACISDMLDDAAFPKLPFSNSPLADNQLALQAVASMAGSQVPFPFLYGILMQESGCQHFQVPSGSNLDNFVTVGCDTNDKANPARITSRGFGIGQYTLFHHPPTPDEVSRFISDPVGNVKQGVAELRGKFDRFVIGPDSRADDRIHEAGSGPLRLCKFDSADPLYLRDCVNCLHQAGTQNIAAGQTPVYDGSPDTYQATQYHKGSYANVPIRKNIPCDWPYAVRRYNGSGPNSYDYQAELLLKVLHSPKVAGVGQ